MAAELKTAEPAVSTAVAIPKRMSYETFLTSPEVDAHTEWIDGKVVPMSPVSDRHADVTVFLLTLIRLFVEKRDTGVVRGEPFQMKTAPDLPGRAPTSSSSPRETSLA